jgi:hypothetical protein
MQKTITRPLSEEEWGHFVGLLEKSGFWAMPTREGDIGLDGASFCSKGRKMADTTSYAAGRQLMGTSSTHAATCWKFPEEGRRSKAGASSRRTVSPHNGMNRTRNQRGCYRQSLGLAECEAAKGLCWF